jgi:uncharacterized protein with HEPN domain
MRRDLAYLEDIVEASDTIAEFIRDQDIESFLSSPMLKSALAHQFTVIGEAAARVAGDLRERHPLIPWAKATGMRNIVVHHYFGVAGMKSGELRRWTSPSSAARLSKP